MNKLIFALLISSLAVACDKGSPSDIDPSELIPTRDKVRRDSNNTEKFIKTTIDATHTGADIAYAENPGGVSIIAGSKGIWMNGTRFSDAITDNGKDIDVAVNINNNWIAAGSKGLFYNGEEVELGPNMSLGSKESRYAVSINDSNQWIAAGNQYVFIKRDSAVVRIDRLDVAKGSGKITAKIFNDGSWVIASDRGVWTSTDSAAESSPQ